MATSLDDGTYRRVCTVLAEQCESMLSKQRKEGQRTVANCQKYSPGLN